MKTITLVLFILLSAAPAFAQEVDTKMPTLNQVTRQLDDMYRAESSHAKMTMTVINKRGTRKLTMETWSKGKDNTLIVIRKPAREAGTATLMTDEGLWNYAPRADRLIRIPSGLLSESWMGSNFTNDDLVRDTRYEDQFKTSMAWGEQDGQKRLVLTMIPKEGTPVVYTKIVYYLLPGKWLPVRADYFDDAKLMRQMLFSDIRDVDGKLVPFKMELIPVNKSERTIVTYEDMKFDVPIKKATFTKQGLRRVAKKR